MTTIAFKPPFLVADSQCSDEDYMMRSYTTKIVKTDEGIGGAAGGAWAGQLFIRWLTGEISPDEFQNIDVGDDFTGMFITWDGQITLYNKYLAPEKIDGEFHSIGSGSKIAMPLMEYGAPARKAVELACKYDLYSGGDLTIIRLEK